MEIGSTRKRCASVQDPALTCDFKTRFVLLLLLTFPFFGIAYFYDFSFKPFFRRPQKPFNVANHTQPYNAVAEELPESKFVWASGNQILQTIITLKKTTAPKDIWINYVAHPSNYHFIMDEPDKCKEENPFLVLMVPVAPKQVDARNAIRSTWGNESTVQGQTVLTLFLVGLTVGPDAETVQKQLEEESREHRDLIQSNFVDSYFNLTIKTMVIMDWLATRCPQAKFSMKIDSDMFINLKNMMTLLLEPKTPKQNYITGFLMVDVLVVRNIKSKYYVSEELYPEKKYPIYVLGVGYVFSNDLPKKIVEVSKDVKPFNIEDAYIGACLKRLGVRPSRAPDPSQFRTYMKVPEGHDLNKVITTIARSPKQITEFWQSVTR